MPQDDTPPKYTPVDPKTRSDYNPNNFRNNSAQEARSKYSQGPAFHADPPAPHQQWGSAQAQNMGYPSPQNTNIPPNASNAPRQPYMPNNYGVSNQQWGPPAPRNAYPPVSQHAAPFSGPRSISISSHCHQQPPPCPPNPLCYPHGYVCHSCRNTGYMPCGTSCKSCWDRFGPHGHVRSHCHSDDDVFSDLGFGGWSINIGSHDTHEHGHGHGHGHGHFSPPSHFTPVIVSSFGSPLGEMGCGCCGGTGMVGDPFFAETCHECGGCGTIDC